MANVATKTSAGPCHLTYNIVGDGTVAGPTIANATLLADMINGGPLFDAWNFPLTTQAAMRLALLGGAGGVNRQGCICIIQNQVTVKDTTAEINQPCADVDTDATTVTKAELNVSMSDTTGQIINLTLLAFHSIIE